MAHIHLHTDTRARAYATYMCIQKYMYIAQYSTVHSYTCATYTYITSLCHILQPHAVL